MKIGSRFVYPEEQQRLRTKARNLSWLSIGLLTSAATLLFATLGQSEAMKTAWVSDVLTAIPPVALLVSMKYELRDYSERFPFGYTRAISVAFLVTSGVLCIVGLYLLYDALSKLVAQQRPSIGLMLISGDQFWAGWAMIAALAYSLVCGLLIGLLKKPVSRKLNDKALYAESTMNRDEWMSEGAAIVGLLLVAFGHWWADAAAAAFISLEIVHDGWINMRLVIGDLMDEAPTRMGSHALEDITAKVRTAIKDMPRVGDAAVRLREHGRALTGELFIVPADRNDIVTLVRDVGERACSVDWRLHDLVVMPVADLKGNNPPRS